MPSTTSVRVWDAPVRVFHWLLVLSFAGAFVTAESERWRLVHVTLGYTVAGLIAFRMVWGLVGTRHARFANFVRGPAAVLAYLRALLRGSPEHHLGHNPAGGWAIVALLLGCALLTASGWATYNEWGGDWLEELHEALGNGLLALIGVHVVGVIVSSRLHQENLVRAMFTGRKRADATQGSVRGWDTLALVLVAAVTTFWWSQWALAPVNTAQTAPVFIASDKARMIPPSPR